MPTKVKTPIAPLSNDALKFDDSKGAITVHLAAHCESCSAVRARVKLCGGGGVNEWGLWMNGIKTWQGGKVCSTAARRNDKRWNVVIAVYEMGLYLCVSCLATVYSQHSAKRGPGEGVSNKDISENRNVFSDILCLSLLSKEKHFLCWKQTKKGLCSKNRQHTCCEVD